MKRNVYTSSRESMVAHDGQGRITMSRVFTGADFESKCDFIDHSVIPPGTSIGYHTHGENEEVYFVIRGKGIMTIDRNEVEISQGDLILNRSGGSHSLRNNGDADIEILVFQVSI